MHLLTLKLIADKAGKLNTARNDGAVRSTLIDGISAAGLTLGDTRCQIYYTTLLLDVYPSIIATPTLFGHPAGLITQPRHSYGPTRLLCRVLDANTATALEVWGIVRSLDDKWK